MPYTHFTEKERYVISHMKLAGFSLRAIGRRLGRSHTSIMREVTRNRPTYADDAVYWYYATQPISEERQHQARKTSGVRLEFRTFRALSSHGINQFRN
jgi:IS30 family transposase